MRSYMYVEERNSIFIYIYITCLQVLWFTELLRLLSGGLDFMRQLFPFVCLKLL